METDLAPVFRPGVGPPPLNAAPATDASIEHLVRTEFSFIWRILRRFGLSAADADDAAQQVFLVAAQKRASIQPGSERAFLFGTANRIASRMLRSQNRRREVSGNQLNELGDASRSPEQLLERRRAGELLDSLLSAMPSDLRVVFVLYEIEQLTMAEISELLGLAPGTVASRLRRARRSFTRKLLRVSAKRELPAMHANLLRRLGGVA